MNKQTIFFNIIFSSKCITSKNYKQADKQELLPPLAVLTDVVQALFSKNTFEKRQVKNMFRTIGSGMHTW